MSDVEWLGEETSAGCTERLFLLRRLPGPVPGVLWSPQDSVPQATVLLFHGGSGHKRSERHLRMGRWLASAAGLAGKFGIRQAGELHPGLCAPGVMMTAASAISAPVLYRVQWDDEAFPRDGQFELFDALASADKQLIARPGPHGRTHPMTRRPGWTSSGSTRIARADSDHCREPNAIDLGGPPTGAEAHHVPIPPRISAVRAMITKTLPLRRCLIYMEGKFIPNGGVLRLVAPPLIWRDSDQL